MAKPRGSANRVYPEESREKQLKNTIKGLKEHIRKLERALRAAKSDRRTAVDAWEKTKDYLAEKAKRDNLESLIVTGTEEGEAVAAAGVQEEAKTDIIIEKGACPECGSELSRLDIPGGRHLSICKNKGCKYRIRGDELSNKTEE